MSQVLVDNKSAIKNIQNVMQGNDDGVILLTEVYHDNEGEDLNKEHYIKHREVLEDINGTLEFINNNGLKQADPNINNLPTMLKSSASIKDSLQKLKALKTNTTQPMDKKEETFCGSISLEQLVMNILKPQIDSWLQNNLVSIVEKAVQEEVKKAIEKIAQND